MFLFSFFTFSICVESLKSKSTQMLRLQKGNSRVSFNDTLLNFGLRDHSVLLWCTVYNLWTCTWIVHFLGSKGLPKSIPEIRELQISINTYNMQYFPQHDLLCTSTVQCSRPIRRHLYSGIFKYPFNRQCKIFKNRQYS